MKSMDSMKTMKTMLLLVLTWVASPALAAPRAGPTCKDPASGKAVVLAKASFGVLRELCDAGACPDACMKVMERAQAPDATEEEVGSRFYLTTLHGRCKRGVLPACREAGERLYDGYGTLEQHAAACELWAEACKGGDALSCAREGLCLERGAEGKAADPTAAAARYKVGCELRDGRSCMMLGSLTLRGEGVTADPARGLDLMDQACEAAYGDGCAFAGGLRNDAGDKVKARALLDKACKLGSAMGCRFAGNLAAAGQGGPRDAAQALAQHERGCELGSHESCNSAAVRLAQGDGVAKDLARATRFFLAGCELGSAMACTNAAKALLDSGSKDYQRLGGLTKRACDLGDEGECARYRKLCEAGAIQCD